MYRDTTNVESEIIPLINGATGILTNDLNKNLVATPGKHETANLEHRT